MLKLRRIKYTLFFSLIILTVNPGVEKLFTSANPFGVMLGGQRMSVLERITVAKDLGAVYFRPWDIDLSKWNGRHIDTEVMVKAGFKVLATVRNDDTNLTPPINLDVYKSSVTDILNKYQLESLVVENEENSTLFFVGTPEEYERELKAAVEISRSTNVQCTNGGLVSSLVALLVWNYYLENNEFTKAESFIQRALARDPDFLEVLNSVQGISFFQTQIKKGKALLDVYKTVTPDYVNFHWYIADSPALQEAVDFLKVATGLPVIINEMGVQEYLDPSTVLSLMTKVYQLNLPYAVWYSVDIEGFGGALALHNPDGTLRDTGKAFKSFIQSLYGTGSLVYYTLTTRSNLTGAGTISLYPGEMIYSAGTNVTLTATPGGNNFTFSHWSGNISSTQNPVTVTMNGNKNIVANFVSTQPVSIQGNFTDLFGLPLSNANVSLFNTAISTMPGEIIRSTTTLTDGSYRFDDLVINGNYLVVPTKSNYLFSPSSRKIAGLTGTVIGEDFVGTYSPLVYYTISGFVKDIQGKALSNVNVRLSSETLQTTITDINGYYEFKSLFPGHYYLTASSSGWNFNPGRYAYSPLDKNKSNQDFIVTQTNLPPSKPTNLKCNGQLDPDVVSGTNLQLSWTFNDPDVNDIPSAYQIIISSPYTDIYTERGTTWDSGKVNVSSEVVIYINSGLVDGVTYYWRVKTWDIANSSGPFSLIAQFIKTRKVNIPPTVNINSPVNGTTYFTFAIIPVQVTAEDYDGTITRVELYSGAIKLDDDWTSPYEFSWFNGTVGNYELKAVAYDNHGLASTYTVINIMVISTNTLPAVPVLLTPVNGYTTNNPTVMFDWSEVTDLSGVTYEIQVSVNSEFSIINYTATPSVSNSQLVTLNFQLYYWRVRAKDGANNYSGWTIPWTVVINSTGKVQAKPDEKFVTSTIPAKFGSETEEVQIYDSTGGIAIELKKHEFNNGLIVWSGKDKTGKTIESGAYIYKIKTLEGKFTYGMIILAK